MERLSILQIKTTTPDDRGAVNVRSRRAPIPEASFKNVKKFIKRAQKNPTLNCYWKTADFIKRMSIETLPKWIQLIPELTNFKGQKYFIEALAFKMLESLPSKTTSVLKWVPKRDSKCRSSATKVFGGATWVLCRTKTPVSDASIRFFLDPPSLLPSNGYILTEEGLVSAREHASQSLLLNRLTIEQQILFRDAMIPANKRSRGY